MIDNVLFHQEQALHVTVTGVEPSRTLSHLAKLAFNDRAVLRVLICAVHLTVRSSHVTYAFPIGSTLYSCLNVKELLVQNWRDS